MSNEGTATVVMVNGGLVAAAYRAKSALLGGRRGRCR